MTAATQSGSYIRAPLAVFASFAPRIFALPSVRTVRFCVRLCKAVRCAIRRTAHSPSRLMRRPLSLILWAAVAALGALALGLIALHRGETINAAWLVIAAVCTYSVAYRFYSRF